MLPCGLHRLQLDDAVLAYDEAGSGPTLLFLHGVGSDRRTWAGQLRRFGSGHTALALDLRGHGDSQAAPASISIERFAADCAELIGRVGAGPAHVCGLSLGGIVALQLWADRPELVRSMILADSWAYHPEAAAGLPARLAGIDARPLPELAAERMPMVVGPGADPALVARAVEVMAGKDPAAYRRSNEVLWGVDMRTVAAGVRIPTLVLVGELDVITPPALSEELAALIPGARLVVIPATGHLSNEVNAAAFDAALAAFVQEVERGNGQVLPC
jgi:3-oxoadipate enol-lactonase